MFTQLRLHALRKVVDAVIELGLARGFRETQFVHGDFHDPFVADELEAEAFFDTAAGEVDSKGESELGMLRGLCVVHGGEHHVGHVAPVFPEAGPAGGIDALGSERTRDDVKPGEQVNEQISCNAGAIVLVVAPAEQTDRLERTLRSIAEESIPVDVLRRGVGRDGILPRADGRVAVEMRGDEVELADRALLEAVRLPSGRRR